MAYFTTNPPVLLQQLHPAGRRLWYYESTDANTVVRVTGYITNGAVSVSGFGPVGMKDKDLIWVMISTTGVITQHIVNVSVAGVVDLSDGTVLSTATNTD